MHTPTHRTCGSDTLAVFVHGFMGSPDQFDDLADAVFAAGIDVATVLLPGHGGTWRDFARSDYRAWQSHLCERLTELSRTYGRIYLVGHSLGCLLSLIECAEARHVIVGAFLLCPAVRLNLRPTAFAARVRVMRDDTLRTAYRDSLPLNSLRSWNVPLLLRPAIGYLTAAGKARKCLDRVRVPVVIVCSRGDEVVAFRSAKILERGLTNAKTTSLTLETSMHARFAAEERALIRDALLDFVR
ncbi:MAG: alpha/beta fold hydrolase [Oscillospiraceae bacterium]|jgi:carboxylesterase|nr:alpha/beta fold hydrolase [Oscillospiraceae bacterium]